LCYTVHMRKLRGRSKEIQLNKLIMMMRLVYMVQCVLVVGVATAMGVQFLALGEVPTMNAIITLLVVIGVMVLFNGYFIFRDTTIFRRLDRRMMVQDESYKNIEALNLKLRSQRHDFLNHIQVLYSLMELEAYDETQAYLNKLYGDVGKVNANIKTKSVAINALLQAKANEAESRGIGFDTVINSKLDRLNLPDWELCRVLGNMIDNGFRAATLSGQEAFVHVSIGESITDYRIIIENASQPIGTDLIKKFFTPGFTTKPDQENHGLGLHISNEIMAKYNNKIDMAYKDGKVVTEVIIQKIVQHE